MLIQFSVSNWRSFKTKQTFNLIKTSKRELSEDNSFISPAYKHPLLKSAVIYGPNAGGKSNFIKALKAVEETVLFSVQKQHGDKIQMEPFLWDENFSSNPTEFELFFIYDEVRYQYGFQANSERIVEEWLFAFPKGVSQKWIGRVWNPNINDYSWDKCPSLIDNKKQKQLWIKSTRQNALFLSTAVHLNCTQLQPVFNWFKDNIWVFNSNSMSYTVTARLFEKKEVSLIPEILKAADLGIENMIVTKRKFSPDLFPSDMPQAIKQELLESMSESEFWDIKTIHKSSQGKLIPLDFEEESSGTKKFFSLIGICLTTLKKGRILIIDELNDSLHPKLLKFLVEIFNDKNLNKKGAQLIFTSHETSLLDQSLLRRDQIWFIEKDNFQASTLTQLIEYKVIKDRENIETHYRAGEYRALPLIRKLAFELNEDSAHGE